MTFLAAVEAAGHVDAHLALAGELEILAALLRVVAEITRAGVVAGDLRARLALVAAEEDVVLVIAHEALFGATLERDVPMVRTASRRDLRA